MSDKRWRHDDGNIDDHIARDDEAKAAGRAESAKLITIMRDALSWIATHDISGVASARRAQVVAAYALRGEPPPKDTP